MKLNVKYIIPALMAGAMLAAAPHGAEAKFLFFGGNDTVRPVISRASADSLALGVVPGTIQSEHTINENGHVAYVYDVSYRGRMHAVTVNGDTGQVIADRIGRGTMFPLNLF
jgi:uncharacterized membrane protein YkoI